MTPEHQAAITALLAVRAERGQEADAQEILDDPLKVRNNLAWVLRRQTPAISDALRGSAQAALQAIDAQTL